MAGKDEQALEEEGFNSNEIKYAFLLFKNNEECYRRKGVTIKRRWENLPLGEKRNWIWVGINDQIGKGKWRGV